MPHATRFCFVRHGETPWNAERRLQGHLDIPLNDHGLTQAAAAASGLLGQGIVAIYSSDLGRARQTAAIAAARLGLPVRHLFALRERHFGAFQGLTYDEAASVYPDCFRRFQQRDPEHAPAGGESLRQLAQRITQALSAIAEQHPAQTVLVVAHGGVLDIVHRLASGRDLAAARDFAIPNAALNWLRYQPQQQAWTLESWADQRHLATALDEL